MKKIKMIVYADYEEIKELDDSEIEGMTDEEIQDYVYDKYMDKFIDNNIQSNVEIIESEEVE